MTRDTVNKSVLLLLVVFISAIFLSMIRSFFDGHIYGRNFFSSVVSGLQTF